MRRSLPLLALAASLCAAPAFAGTIEVTTLQINAPPGECELDEAIIMVNDFPSQDRFGCQRVGGGPDEIVFASGLAGTIGLDAPLPPIERTLTIRGPGADLLGIDGEGLHQAITVNAGVTFTLEGITIEGANGAAGAGGALSLQSGSQVTLRDCRITSSQAADGGAIHAAGGLLRVERCLLDGNSASQEGGALLVDGADAELVNTTLSGNTAASGGGIAVAGAGLATLRNVTLAQNDATTGGNAFVETGSALGVRHTLFAQPLGGGNCGGAVTSSDFNLADDATCSLAGAGDLAGVPAGLAALSDNGGPTATHALQTGSAAIDAGATTCRDAQDVLLATDQRGPGFPRPTDGDGLPGYECDIGAFEAAPEPGAAAAAAAAGLALAALARRRRTRVP